MSAHQPDQQRSFATTACNSFCEPDCGHVVRQLRERLASVERHLGETSFWVLYRTEDIGDAYEAYKVRDLVTDILAALRDPL